MRMPWSCRAAMFLLLACTGFALVRGSSDCDACGREIRELGLREVCGSDGFTYLRSCLAECQNVAVAHAGSCTGGSAVAGGATAASAAAGQQKASGDTTEGLSVAVSPAPPLLDAATIGAYAKEGLRCVGYMARTTFDPATPVVPMRRLNALQGEPQRMGATMMVTATGIVYAAPPSQQQVSSAVTDVRTDGSELQQVQLATSTAPAPVGRRLLRAQTMPAFRRLLRHAAHSVAGSLWSPTLTGRRMKAIFGADTRQEIPLTPTDALYTPVGHILFTSATSGVRYQCTGSMIGPYTVLTAAHCLVDRNGNMQASIEFTPAQTYRNQSGLGTATGLRVYFNKEYLGENWEAYDVGILVLDRPFGVQTQQDYDNELLLQLQASPADLDVPGPRGLDASILSQYQLQAWPAKRFDYAAVTTRLRNVRLFSAGYPGDKKFNSFWRLACKISEGAGPVGPIVVNYCPSASGQSGAPFVEVKSGKQGTQRLVRAVLSFEMCEDVCDGRCCNGIVKYNGAVRISPTIKAFIDQYVDQRPNILLNSSPGPSPSPSITPSPSPSPSITPSLSPSPSPAFQPLSPSP